MQNDKLKLENLKTGYWTFLEFLSRYLNNIPRYRVRDFQRQVLGHQGIKISQPTELSTFFSSLFININSLWKLYIYKQAEVCGRDVLEIQIYR